MRKVSVIIAPEALAFMYHCAGLAKGEIGGPMRVGRRDGALYVHSPELIEQKATGASVTMDPEKLMAWEIANVEGQGDGMPLGDHGWWHSHADMSVGFSTTDDEFVSDHATRGLFVSVVVNKEHDVHCQVNCFVGSKNKRDAFLVRVPCEWRQGTILTEERQAEIKAQFEELVTHEAVTSTLVLVDGEDCEICSLPFREHGTFGQTISGKHFFKTPARTSKKDNKKGRKAAKQTDLLRTNGGIIDKDGLVVLAAKWGGIIKLWPKKPPEKGFTRALVNVTGWQTPKPIHVTEKVWENAILPRLSDEAERFLFQLTSRGE